MVPARIEVLIFRKCGLDLVQVIGQRSASREKRCPTWMAAAVPPTSTASGRIRCKRAADDSTVSHSGKVRVGIVHPEVITLGIGVSGP
jgi:hypothetical protein